MWSRAPFAIVTSEDDQNGPSWWCGPIARSNRGSSSSMTDDRHAGTSSAFPFCPARARSSPGPAGRLDELPEAFSAAAARSESRAALDRVDPRRKTRSGACPPRPTPLARAHVGDWSPCSSRPPTRWPRPRSRAAAGPLHGLPPRRPPVTRPATGAAIVAYSRFSSASRRSRGPRHLRLDAHRLRAADGTSRRRYGPRERGLRPSADPRLDQHDLLRATSASAWATSAAPRARAAALLRRTPRGPEGCSACELLPRDQPAIERSRMRR